MASVRGYVMPAGSAPPGAPAPPPQVAAQQPEELGGGGVCGGRAAAEASPPSRPSRSQSDLVSSASRSEQQTCLDCKKNFCTTCSSQVGTGPRLCLLCQRFRATAFQREELMKMKVKDLRDYLSLHDISTDMCREKEELVFLVLGQQPVISQEGRTRAPTLAPDSPEQQAFLSQPHTSTVAPTSPGHPSAPVQATSVPLALAQPRQQVWPLCSLTVSGVRGRPLLSRLRG